MATPIDITKYGITDIQEISTTHHMNNSSKKKPIQSLKVMSKA